jgi:hypothetical protein
MQATGSPGSSFDHGGCPEVRVDMPTSSEPDIDRLLEPRSKKDGSLRCRVRRMREKSMLELSIEEGNVFVLTAARSGKDWIISEQHIAGANKQGHIVRMRTHKDRTFTCVRRRHETSNAPPELIFVHHSTEKLSEDLPELNTMQIALPRVSQDGQLDVPPGTLMHQMRRVVNGHERAGQDIVIMESRRPKWNPRTETYELPFGGRANWASARNFQLIEREGAADRAVLLYGKMEEDEFAMDFAWPLSLLHAFSIVLTTWGW